MKTNKLFYKFTIVLLATFFVLSCQEELDIKIDNDLPVKIAVDGRITNIGQHQLLRLTKSDDYFANRETAGAEVEYLQVLEKGTGKIYAFSKVDTGAGYYISDEVFSGKVKETYELTFNFGPDKYSASAFLDTVPAIDSISYQYEYFNYFGGQGYYQIKMSATEPEPAGDYYLFYLYINDTLYNNELRLTANSDDEIINGKPLINIDIYYLPQEEIKSDTNRIRLEMLSISREEYAFIIAFLNETRGNGSLFSGPPADIPTNIENKSSDNSGLGFFSASSVSSKEMFLYKVHSDSTNNSDYKR
jgi:hypothetical protein